MISIVCMAERNPFNKPCAPKKDTPYWLKNGLEDQAEVDRHMAEHRRRMGMDRIRVPSPSAICGLIGCTNQLAHDHEVVA